MSSSAAGDPLAIRPPVQQRSREAWARILDAGDFRAAWVKDPDGNHIDFFAPQ